MSMIQDNHADNPATHQENPDKNRQDNRRRRSGPAQAGGWQARTAVMVGQAQQSAKTDAQPGHMRLTDSAFQNRCAPKQTRLLNGQTWQTSRPKVLEKEPGSQRLHSEEPCPGKCRPVPLRRNRKIMTNTRERGRRVLEDALHRSRTNGRILTTLGTVTGRWCWRTCPWRTEPGPIVPPTTRTCKRERAREEETSTCSS